MAKLISKTYGEALFELAVEENKTDVFVEEIQGVLEVLEANPEFDNLMNHPKILKEEKIGVMENVFKGRISEELVGFVALIIKKDRYGDITSILQYFLQEVKALKGIGTAYVTTAVELRTEQQKNVEDTLLAKTPFKQMEMHYDVDESLIGGMVIRIGDRVVDSSIKHKLDELTRQLMKVQLA
jgi:F-type H+-transporting ATPase subunit delta